MSRPNSNRSDVSGGFALVGSQIGTSVSSARRHSGSTQASGRSSARSQTENKVMKRVGSNPSLAKGASAQLTSGGGDGRMESNRSEDELLSFFESKPVQPQIRKPQATRQPLREKTKAAWGANTSARSARSSARGTMTLSGRGETTSGPKRPSSGSRKAPTPSHSVFQPTDTARTGSTLSDAGDGLDEFDALMAKISQDATELQIDDVLRSFEHTTDAKSDRSPRDAPLGNGIVQSIESQDEAPVRAVAEAPIRAVGEAPIRAVAEGPTQMALKLSSGQVESSLLSPKISNISANSFPSRSVANNMSAQATKGPAPRSSLSAMENSVQNFKRKSPINQMHDTVGRKTAAVDLRTTTRSFNAEIALQDERKRKAMAASKIQIWFRRHYTRLKVGEAAVKRLLDAKRQEREAQLQLSTKQSSIEEQQRQTAEQRARHKRQEAIKELQQKRNEKRLKDEQVAQAELKFLKESGKVGKKPTRPVSVTKKTTAMGSTKTKSMKSKVKDSDSEDEKKNQTGRSSARSNKNFKHAASEASNFTDRSEDTRMHDAPSPQPSQATSEKTTVEDILDTLKKLEEEHTFEKQKNQESKNEKPLAWLDDLDKSSDKDDMKSLGAWEKPRSHRSRDEASQAQALGQRSAAEGSDGREHANNVGAMSDAKMNHVMAYLDDLQTADRVGEIEQDLTRENQTLNYPVLLMPSGEQLVELEQASANAQEVTTAVLTQKMELEEKKRTVLTLQKALNQQRELTVRHAKETEREFKQQMQDQKLYFEGKISSQVGFIDQLIEDKKLLSERCDQMVREMKRAHEKYSAKFKAMEESHAVEMKKLKDFHEAAEKLRREKWFKDMEKTVKEDTVRGMMPEIQTLIAKHKSELRKIKSIHEAELLASDERVAKRYVHQTEELREQLQREKEGACQHERELARQMYEKHMSEAEEDFQQRRRRLYEEVREEKERQGEAARRQRSELDRLQRHLEDSHQAAVDTLRKEYEKARNDQDVRHEEEMRKLKEQLKIEKSSWEENYMKKQETWMLQKERELKERIRQERDQEIESVITTLEDDQTKARKDYEKNMENRLRRTKEKYEKELSDLEASEKAACEKYNKTKALLLDTEGEQERLKVLLHQKERDNADYKNLLEKLNEERSHVSDVVRQEFADRIVSTEEENKRLKNELTEAKARAKVESERSKQEIEVVKKRSEDEMEEVHSKVKQAILKKEEVVQQLKQQYQAAVTRADHLEGLLEQQRKQLLGRK